MTSDEMPVSTEAESSSSESEEELNSLSNLAEETMRRDLQFFFMNPIEKWQAKRRFPYKFVVQLIKIFLVTMQLCLFAHSRYTHVNYTWDNKISFSHLFLKGWDAAREVNTYPPASGPLAIYKSDDFYSTLDYIYEGYANLSAAIGVYSYASENNNITDPTLCLYKYKKGIIFGFNESYIFDAEVTKTCHNWHPDETGKISSRKHLLSIYNEILFSELVKVTVNFSVKTVNFKAAGRITPPDCYQFFITITLDNEDHDGQMKLSLDAEPIRLICKGDIKYITDNEIDSFLRSILNYFVIFICALSLILCCRAIYRAHQLKVVTVAFFNDVLGEELSAEGRLEFLNMWYIMIIINDILIIVGSSIKEQIERKQFAGDRWNICSIFLGTGNMLVWFGVLRYLGFFKTYNVVILTLKAAAPKVARFLLCALLIYAGYTFCGWLILGPYHMKFRSLATTSECLFALINGDDMFATFSIMSFKSPMLWWYSRLYLYSFISLYIYVILSCFLSVIIDAYDTIKQYYLVGFPKTDLQQFIGPTQIEDLSSGVFQNEPKYNLIDLIKKVCCQKKERNSYSTIGESRPNSKNSGTAICV